MLLPVLDDAKHYWVSPDEVDKLVRAGEGWLADHPDRELISRRYLAHRSTLYRSALSRLAEVDDTDPVQLDNATDRRRSRSTYRPARRCRSSQQRHTAVLDCVARRGCAHVSPISAAGRARSSPSCWPTPTFTRVVAADVSARALQDRGAATQAGPDAGTAARSG